MWLKCNFCKTKSKVPKHFSLSKSEGDGQKYCKLSVEALLTWSYKSCNWLKPYIPFKVYKVAKIFSFAYV